MIQNSETRPFVTVVGLTSRPEVDEHHEAVFYTVHRRDPAGPGYAVVGAHWAVERRPH